jgi:hypothetical protein
MARRRTNAALAVLVVALVAVGAALVIGVVYGQARGDRPGGGTTEPASTPAPPSGAASQPTRSRPDADLGAGTPGAGCATNRLGHTFTKDGVVYTCKGPKPYSWQP